MELKFCHALVLKNLGEANARYNRVVDRSEIMSMFSSSDIEVIKNNFMKKPADAVTGVLTLLEARGLIFIWRNEQNHCFYGSYAVLNESTGNLPTSLSRRRRVLTLVYQAVQFYRRAVRAPEVWEYAVKTDQSIKLNKIFVVRDMRSLSETGELKIAAVSRGISSGNNLYLPSEMNTAEYLPETPLTVSELVLFCFNQIWEQHLNEAEQKSEKPRPVSTGEVRAAVFCASFLNSAEVNARRVISVLKSLAEVNDPPLRKVNRAGFKSVLWVPANVTDAEITAPSIVYVSDAERIEEAVRRSELCLRRPVSVREIESQIKIDENLKPKSKKQIFRIINDAAKPMSSADARIKKSRKIKFAGSVGGSAYYSAGIVSPAETAAYLQWLEIKTHWENLNFKSELERINYCTLSVLRNARLIQLASETDGVRLRLEKLLAANGEFSEKPAAEEMRENISFLIQNNFDEHILNSTSKSLNENFNNDFADIGEGLAPNEVVYYLKPFYPMARKIEVSNRIVTLLEGSVKRVRNPNFAYRFHRDQQRACEYLFEYTDFFIYTALQWGEKFSRIQALTARQELGNWRNSKIVIPLLKDEDFTVRLKAAACLAFLPGANVQTALQNTAETDIEPNVRNAAKWSLLIASHDLNNFIEALSY